MSESTPSKECKNCGKDLSSFDESNGKRPCPNCGSKKRIEHARVKVPKVKSTVRASATVNVRIFSPLSKHLKKLMEFHSGSVDGLQEKENSLGIILFAHIFIDTYLYESLVDSNVLTDKEYQDECDHIWNNRHDLRANIKSILAGSSKFNNLSKKKIPAIEVKYYYLLKEHLGVDFYKKFSENLEDFRKLINLRNEITHFKEYEVTDINSDDRLKRRIDLETANKLKNNAFNIATKIDSLVESD